MARFKYPSSDVISMYQNGIEINEIASRLNTDYRAIWQLLMRLKKLKRKGNRRLQLAGKRFGKLTVLSFKGLDRKSIKTMWNVICDCGNKKVVTGYSLTGGNCQSCGCNIGFDSGSKHKSWVGFGKISGSHWCKIKESAARRNFSVEITIQEAWGIFECQKGRCALSGIAINFAPDINSHAHGGTSASLDRIDSKKGYITGNIQWVHKMINRMKWGLTTNQFVGLCSKVATHSVMSKSEINKINDGIDGIRYNQRVKSLCIPILEGTKP